MNTKIRKKPVVYKAIDGSKKGASLDTLAQLGTSPENEALNLDSNTSQDDSKTLLKRARRKFFTNGLVIGLANAAEKSSTSVLEKSYWNTYHCSSTLQAFEDGTIAGKYCKNRWCMVCNAIRTAQSILTYVPVIRSWDDSHFCTATRPNVKAADLEKEIKELHHTFHLIKEKIKQQNKRKKIDFTLVGVRKFECTYNAIKDTYHPHFHIVFKTRDQAITFMGEWMRRNPSANSKGQDIRPADSNSLIELFKYMTKVISKTGKGNRVIYADAMDVVFNSMRGKRTMQNFGFKLPKIEGIDDSKVVDKGFATDVLQWQQCCADWVNVDTGELLTNYVPGEEFKRFVNEKIIVR